jgi:hypothetical protein
MNFEYHHLLPEHFSPKSRVWVYQSNRLFTLSEAFDIEDILQQFTDSWASHGAKVTGYANLLFGQFIILMADETEATVSGCSTDGSVRLIKHVEQKFGVDMFNRTSLAFVVKDKVEILPMHQLEYAFQNNFLTADTLYFNNLVQTKKELEKEWLIPIKKSWISQKLQLQTNY